MPNPVNSTSTVSLKLHPLTPSPLLLPQSRPSLFLVLAIPNHRLPAPQTLLPPSYLNPLLRDEFSHRTAQIIPLYTYPKPSVDSHSLLKQSIQSPKFFPFLSFTAFHYTPYSNTTRLLIVLWPYCFRFLECPVSPSLHPNATSSMKRRLHLWLGVTFSVFSFFWHVESCCSLLYQIN